MKRIEERPLTEAAWFWLMIWRAQHRLLEHNPDGTVKWPTVPMRR